MSRPHSHWAVAPEPDEPNDDEARVVGEEAGWGEVQAFEDAGTEGVEEDVGVCEEGEEEGP